MRDSSDQNGEILRPRQRRLRLRRQNRLRLLPLALNHAALAAADGHPL